MNGKLDDGFLRRNVHLGSTNAVGVRVLGMRYLKERLRRKQEQDCAAFQEANQKKEFVVCELVKDTVIENEARGIKKR